MPRPPLDGTVLVTGASSGIGAEFARQLAASAGKLILVARRRDRLEALRDELSSRHPGAKIALYARDLARPGEIEALVADLDRDGHAVDVLINNAGMGDIGVFEGCSRERIEQMIGINVLGFTLLAHHLYQRMVIRGRGGILNVSSGFGLVAMPGFVPYIGTKHYVSGFTDALRMEAKTRGISVCQLCPGPVRTEFEDRAESRIARPVPPWLQLTAERAVRDALSGFRRDRGVIIPGWLHWFGIGLGRLSPRWLLALVFAPVARLLARDGGSPGAG